MTRPLPRLPGAAAVLGLALVMTLARCNCGPPDVPGAGDDSGVDAGDAGDAGLGELPEPDAGWLDAGTTCTPPFADAGVLVRDHLSNPRRLAREAGALYVVETGTLNGADGRVLRLPVAGGAEEEVANGLHSPDAIAVSATHVYVLDADGLVRIEKKSLQQERLALRSNAIFGNTELRLAGSDVVVATGLRWLSRVSPDGGTVDLYSGDAGSSVSGAALDGQQVYFLVSGVPEAGLYQVPVDGSQPARRLRSEPTEGHALLVTASNFLWSEGGGGAGKLRISPRMGGVPNDIATGLAAPARMALVGQVVYFTDAVPGDSAFLRYASLCARGSSFAVGPTGTGPGDVLFDGKVLSFTSLAGGDGGYVAQLPPL